MKRLLAAILILAALVGLAAVPAAAVGTDVVIDAPSSPFPADTVIDGDLIITGNCPETIILINVTVSGTLRVEANRDVTIRLQGDSSCAAAEISSNAAIIGGSFGSIAVNAPYLRFEAAEADTMDLLQPGSVVTLEGTVGNLTVSGEDCFVGGTGRAEKAIINAPGCNLYVRCGETEKNAEEDADSIVSSIHSIRASFSINPTVSPADSIVNASVTFSNVPENLAGDYRIYWYINDTLSYYDWHLNLEEGATAAFTASVHFDGEMDVIPVWCKLVSTESGNDTVLTFATSTRAVNYSTAQYASMEKSGAPYSIHLLRNQGVIIVYGLDSNGEYTKIVNVFACSVGYYNETQVGDYEIGLQMRWGALMSDLYGQYCSQFNYNQLFHSVPYRSKEPNNLEYWEYEKLGSAASSGCVRLAVADARWIYMHCSSGTKVKVYDTDTCPVVQPVPVVIREDSFNRGWDPTDPDPDNPTRADEVPVIITRSPDLVHPHTRNYKN